MQNLDKEVKKAVEQLTAGEKIQLELDRKNQVLKIWKLKLDKVEVKDGTNKITILENMKNK